MRENKREWCKSTISDSRERERVGRVREWGEIEREWDEKEWSEKVWSKRETVGLERQWSEIKEREGAVKGGKERVGQKGKKKIGREEGQKRKRGERV